MIWIFLALALCAAALGLAAYEVALHLRRQPANDTDALFLSARLRARMRVAALLLAVAFALIMFTPRA